MAHTFNHCTWEAEAGRYTEMSLFYSVSSRTEKATQRNSLSEKPTARKVESIHQEDRAILTMHVHNGIASGYPKQESTAHDVRTACHFGCVLRDDSGWAEPTGLSGRPTTWKN